MVLQLLQRVDASELLELVTHLLFEGDRVSLLLDKQLANGFDNFKDKHLVVFMDLQRLGNESHHLVVILLAQLPDHDDFCASANEISEYDDSFPPYFEDWALQQVNGFVKQRFMLQKGVDVSLLPGRDVGEAPEDLDHMLNTLLNIQLVIKSMQEIIPAHQLIDEYLRVTGRYRAC